MHVLDVIATVVPLALLSAVSPMVFVNSTTIELRDGVQGAWRYVAGNAVIVAALCVLGAGLLGAAFTTFVEREVVSAGVDTVLAAALLCYGIFLLRQDARSGSRTAPESNNFVRGMMTMGTNFTSIPLVLAASQHIGASGWPAWSVLLSVVVVAAITLLPAWLPILLATVVPGLLPAIHNRQQHQHRRSWSTKISGLLPVGTCFVGATFLVLHSVSH